MELAGIEYGRTEELTEAEILGHPIFLCGQVDILVVRQDGGFHKATMSRSPQDKFELTINKNLLHFEWGDPDRAYYQNSYHFNHNDVIELMTHVTPAVLNPRNAREQFQTLYLIYDACDGYFKRIFRKSDE